MGGVQLSRWQRAGRESSTHQGGDVVEGCKCLLYIYVWCIQGAKIRSAFGFDSFEGRRIAREARNKGQVSVGQSYGDAGADVGAVGSKYAGIRYAYTG